MMSSPMLDRFQDKGFGTRIKLSDNEEINIPAFAFVDDVDLIQELQGEDDIKSPQLITDEWQDSLESNGGLLGNEKCKYAIVRYRWKSNRWQMEHKTDDKITINIRNTNGIATSIKQNEPKKGELALGIMFSLSGSMEDEVIYLKAKAERWASNIQTGFLNNHDK
jgi:hypothetical protein